MSTFDLENPEPNTGDALRDEAANLLAVRYGRPRTEHREMGKKTDVFFVEKRFGKETRHYVEAKDYNRKLHRNDLVHIWSDYSGVVDRNKPANLIVVTRSGLSADAQMFIDEQAFMMHQTIWELESETLGIVEYVRHLAGLYEADGLSKYYVPCRAKAARYEEDHAERVLADSDVGLLAEISTWMDSDDCRPIAVLGGYGAGKTSLATRIISDQAKLALVDPLCRIPLLIRLGSISRFSSLEGILGGLFTSEFPAHGFDFRLFKQLNERGRMLIVLDGFDEMKHAMTWADFRSQVADLTQLIVGKAKVIILGRPTAFIDHDEHIFVLKGLKPFGKIYRRLPDWPDFHEYDIQPFSPQERADFTRRYLTFRAESARSDEITADWIARRIEEVTELADSDRDVFAKPVHARILTDLACDPRVDLTQFRGRITQWILYEEFVSSLLAREMEKTTRKVIGEDSRRTFLRELAFWLWSERASATSFHAEDIPAFVFERAGVVITEHEDNAVRREFLIGAFLEKKSGDIFYFAHRSFAEFLVADYMLATVPTGNRHSQYSFLEGDGFVSFIREANNVKQMIAWGKTLITVNGTVLVTHITLILSYYPNLQRFLDDMSGCPPLRALCQNIFRSTELKPGSVLNKSLLQMMRSGNEDAFHLALALYSSYTTDGISRQQLDRDMEIVAASILDRVFATATQDVTSRRWSISDEFTEARTLLAGVMPDIRSETDGRYIVFSLPELGKRNSKHVNELGFQVRGAEGRGFLEIPLLLLLPVRSIRSFMTSSNAEKLDIFVRDANHFRGVFARA